MIVRRPSGKITTGRPVSTRRQMSLIPKGLAESTARCGISFSSTRNKGLLLTCEWTTNVASTGRNTASRRPSRKDSWLATMSVRSLTNTRASPVTEMRNSGRSSMRNTDFPSARWKGVLITLLPDLCCCTRTATIGSSASNHTQVNAPPPEWPSLLRFTTRTWAFPARTSASNCVRAESKWSIICAVAAVNPSTPASRETRSS